ncbi:MAG TPA: HD-GYP domain-containing protein [Moraxellaceae bacterium]|nr:HD-GYP domain-containing protein [Moraxellaceae bacterium]
MAAVEHKTIRVDELQVGMYVSKLDRPWIETPFPLQGFYIRELADIDQLRRHCRNVTIDLSRSRAAVEPVRHVAAPPAAPAEKAAASRAPAPKVRRPVYQNTVSMPQEVNSSRELHTRFADAVTTVYQRLAQGRPLDLGTTREVTGQVVESVIRNPDAMVWLSRVRNKDSYSYHHAFRCAIWGTVFGRHLGLSKTVLEQLALGLTLMDVGKAKLPDGLLNKNGLLSPSERTELRRHVDYSLEILGTMPGMPAAVMQMVAEHHERFDGSGYPNQLAGKAISPLGKIAGLVDTYDAMTSERPYARALTSVEAVSRLYELRNTEFQAQLVEEFIQAIGVYPTGTLVHLSNHEVGVVIAQNPERRLRPKLLVLLDGDKKPVARPRYLDMMTTTHDTAGEPLRIITSLLPGSFGVDPARVQLAA